MQTFATKLITHATQILWNLCKCQYKPRLSLLKLKPKIFIPLTIWDEVSVMMHLTLSIKSQLPMVSFIKSKLYLLCVVHRSTVTQHAIISFSNAFQRILRSSTYIPFINSWKLPIINQDYFPLPLSTIYYIFACWSLFIAQIFSQFFYRLCIATFGPTRLGIDTYSFSKQIFHSNELLFTWWRRTAALWFDTVANLQVCLELQFLYQEPSRRQDKPTKSKPLLALFVLEK